MEQGQTTRRVQPGVEVNGDLWGRFRDHVEDRHGSIRGNLARELENAIKDRISAYEGEDTHGRLTRIENRLEDIAGAIESDSDSDSRTDSVSTTTENRISDIMADIRQRADELDSSQVRESDVEASIERHAGTSYKTIQRYKKLLQNQRKLFAHPVADDVYFVKPAAFIAYIEQNDRVPQATRDEIAGTYGWEWWEDRAPNGLLDSGKGFE